MSPLNVRVGARIRQRRRELGYSPLQLARLCGRSKNFVYYVERGTHCVSVENLLDIARVLGRSLDWFVRDAPDAYGVCPHCGERCIERERRPDGNDRCVGGHVYPSTAAVQTKRDVP